MKEHRRVDFIPSLDWKQPKFIFFFKNVGQEATDKLAVLNKHSRAIQPKNFLKLII